MRRRLPGGLTPAAREMHYLLFGSPPMTARASSLAFCREAWSGCAGSSTAGHSVLSSPAALPPDRLRVPARLPCPRLLWFKRRLPRYATKFIEMCVVLCADHGPCVSGECLVCPGVRPRAGATPEADPWHARWARCGHACGLLTAARSQPRCGPSPGPAAAPEHVALVAVARSNGCWLALETHVEGLFAGG